MRFSVLFSLVCLFLFLGQQSVSAQIWKNGEQKQAINREATTKKKLINNENALRASKDAINQGFYNQRITLLKEVETDIVAWNAKIKAGEQLNSQRYNLLTNLKLGKSDAYQELITIRSAELIYEAFGGAFKEEALGILTKLRGKINANLQFYDEAINELAANIQ